MFTGIIEEIGHVSDFESLGDSVRLTISAHKILGDAHLGDSISVDGVCLTIAEYTPDSFTADCMQETLDRSSMGEFHVGTPVNLERAAAVNSRLGGHIVQGHVDGTTRLVLRSPSDNWEVLRFSLPRNLSRYVVEKGSITVNGTSLTVSALGIAGKEEYFEVSLIPGTLRDTNLGKLAVGEQVNLEVDVIAKYVERMLNSNHN